MYLPVETDFQLGGGGAVGDDADHGGHLAGFRSRDGFHGEGGRLPGGNLFRRHGGFDAGVVGVKAVNLEGGLAGVLHLEGEGGGSRRGGGAEVVVFLVGVGEGRGGAVHGFEILFDEDGDREGVFLAIDDEGDVFTVQAVGAVGGGVVGGFDDGFLLVADLGGLHREADVGGEVGECHRHGFAGVVEDADGHGFDVALACLHEGDFLQGEAQSGGELIGVVVEDGACLALDGSFDFQLDDGGSGVGVDGDGLVEESGAVLGVEGGFDVAGLAGEYGLFAPFGGGASAGGFHVFDEDGRRAGVGELEVVGHRPVHFLDGPEVVAPGGESDDCLGGGGESGE